MSLLISALATFANAQEVKTGVFEFATWDGPALKIHYAEPAASAADAPIVFVMHGAGIYFIKTGAAEAKALNVKSGWSFKIVKGAGHDNRLMAKAAAAMIDAFDQLEKDAP